MAVNDYNLDDVQEFFTFTAKGNQYKFTHMTTEQLQEFVKLKDDKDPESANQYISKFITKVDEKAPEFAEVYKKFTVPQLVKFQKMIETEFGMN